MQFARNQNSQEPKYRIEIMLHNTGCALYCGLLQLTSSSNAKYMAGSCQYFLYEVDYLSNAVILVESLLKKKKMVSLVRKNDPANKIAKTAMF